MIYLLGTVSFCIQIVAIMHAIRTGRNQIWIWVILFGSMLGVTAYFAFELMPEWLGPAGARARVKAAADPFLRLKEAEKGLSLADTAANHLAKADALFDMKSFGEASHHYRVALDRLNGRDARTEARLAAALFEHGRHDEALKTLDRLETPSGIGEADRLKLLRARTLTELGREDEALPLYAEISTRMPGPEARSRYAALLLARGDTATARIVLSELVAGNVAMMSGEERQMHLWADGELKRLRLI